MATKRNREHSITTMRFIPHQGSPSSRSSTRTGLVALFIGILAIIGETNAFQLSPAYVGTTRLQGRLHQQTSSRLKAWNHGNAPSPSSSNRNVPSFFVFPSRQTTTAGLTTAIASALIMDDPIVEAHVLTDVAHIGLDLAVFMGQGVLALRLAAVIGRLCSMAADYIPDHTMVPDEFAFQAFMLLLSCWGLLRAAFLPSVAAIASNLKIRDGKAFRSLFAPTGLTWNHYKAMAAVGAVDWVTLQQGESVLLDDEEHQNNDKNHVYWLYDGEMELQSRRVQATTLHELPPKLVVSRSKRDTANAPAALLAEHRLLLANNTRQQHSYKTPTATAHVTSETAVFLRLNVSRLKRFITDNDPAAAEAMRVLHVQGLDAKLDAHWSRMAQL